MPCQISTFKSWKPTEYIRNEFFVASSQSNAAKPPRYRSPFNLHVIAHALANFLSLPRVWRRSFSIGCLASGFFLMNLVLQLLDIGFHLVCVPTSALILNADILAALISTLWVSTSVLASLRRLPNFSSLACDSALNKARSQDGSIWIVSLHLSRAFDPIHWRALNSVAQVASLWPIAGRSTGRHGVTAVDFPITAGVRHRCVVNARSRTLASVVLPCWIFYSFVTVWHHHAAPVLSRLFVSQRPGRLKNVLSVNCFSGALVAHTAIFIKYKRSLQHSTWQIESISGW